MAQVTNKYNICVGKSYMSGNEQKTQWVTIGDAVMMDDGKIYLNINCTPTFQWDGRATLYAKDQPNMQGAQAPQQGSYRNNNQQPQQGSNQQYRQDYQPQGMYSQPQQAIPPTGMIDDGLPF